MTPATWAEDANPVSALFRLAYREFQALLVQAAPHAAPASDALSGQAAAALQPALLDICSRLARSFRQRLTLGDLGHGDALQYAFAAIADEILLNADWPGARAWSGFLLERSLFQTQLAGDRLFDRMLLTLRSPRSQRSIEMAELYLHCLTLGFQGRYRGTEDGPQILARLHEELFAYVHGQAPQTERPGYVLHEAREQCLLRTPPRQRGLAERARWHLVLLGALAIPFVCSAFAWYAVRAELADVLWVQQ
jgi:type VI secretion system protein ImpK